MNQKEFAVKDVSILAGPILLIRKMKQIYINQSNNVSNFVKLKNAKALIPYRPSLLKWKRIERS